MTHSPQGESRVARNFDELERMIQEDELADKVADATHATPREYAKSRGMSPQRVYYYLRRGKLVPDWCLCGRLVLVIEEADEFFNSISKDKPTIETPLEDTNEDL